MCVSLALLATAAAASAGAALGACSSFSSTDPSTTDAAAEAVDGADADAALGVDAAPPILDGGTTYRDVILAAKPLVYWRMGIKSGFVIPDETGSANELVLKGVAGSYTHGVPGAIPGDDDTAVRFDGYDGHAVANDPRAFDFLNGAPFTLELWAKRDEIEGGSYFNHLVTHSVGASNNRSGFLLYVLPRVTAGTGAFTRSAFEYESLDGGDTDSNIDLVPAGQWAHYVGVYDKGYLTLYVNGNSNPAVKAAGVMTATNAELVVAGAIGGQNFPGSIDEVAIYDHALTFKEIAAHHALGAK